ncbi:MAG: thiolase family protein [Oligoflexia bacterium]|nr:thiolase family protein [Oligoflexia bacterium]
MHNAYIIDAVRTPRGKRKGKLSSVHPVDLLTYPLQALATRNNIPLEQVDDVTVGCVTQTGEQGWCVGRAGVLAAGWPISVPATTINRLCGSGQQAFNFAATAIMAGQYQLAVASGLEHMTRCPMFSDISGEISPKLKAQYPDLVQQGMAAELLAEHFNLSRAQLDEYACASQLRAAAAQADGRFAKSLVPVDYTDEHGQTSKLTADEAVRPATTVEGLAQLKPVFKEGGVITAGNASSIVDGAAAILLASERTATTLNLRPRARVVSMSQVGSPPRIMLTGPIAASKQALQRAGLNANQIDLWEINEAFAAVPLVTMQELGVPASKCNVNGGGVSLGHPLGATGVMLINTALDELERSGGRYALITMCIGLGMGIATIIERL